MREKKRGSATMNEKELAQYFEQRKGDTSAWSQPIRASVRQGGSTVFSLRLAPEELEAIRQRAEAYGVSVSEFVRAAALSALASDGPQGSALTIWKIYTAKPGTPDEFVDAGFGTRSNGRPSPVQPSSVAGADPYKQAV